MALNNASYSFTCTVKQANGQPYDLTGKTLVMGFKNSTGTSGGGFTTIQTTDNSIAVQSPSTNGIFVGTLTKAQMTAMAQGTWYWDLLDITNSTNPTALGAGILPVKQGITNSATPSLPSPGLLIPNGSLDAIQVTAPGDSIYLTLEPSGPPGTAGVSGFNLKLFEAFGAAGDGVTDDSAAINNAIVWSAANGIPVYGQAKTYAVAGHINALSNATVIGLSGCTILQTFGFSGSAGVLQGGSSGSHISNFTCKNIRITQGTSYNFTGNITSGSPTITNVSSMAGIQINGYVATTSPNINAIAGQIQSFDPVGMTITLNSNATANLSGIGMIAMKYGGNPIKLAADNTLLQDIQCDTFANGRGIFFSGINSRIINPIIINPLPTNGSGGIRIDNGTDIIVANSYIVAGDDAFQLVGSNTTTSDIVGCWYIGGVGFSYAARLCVCLTGGSPTMNIKSSGFIGISGATGGAHSCYISGASTSGVVKGILVQACVFGDDAGRFACVSADHCEDITFRDCGIVSPYNIGGNFTLVTNLIWDGGYIEPSQNGGNAMTLSGITGGRICGHFSGAAGGQNISLQAQGGQPCTDIDFTGCLLDNIQNGQWGINMGAAVNCGANYGTVFLPAAGATTAGSVNMQGSPSAHCYLTGADLSAMSAQGPGNYESLNVAGGVGHIVNDLYGDSTVAGQVANPTVTWSGSGSYEPTGPYTELFDSGSYSVTHALNLGAASDGYRVRVVKTSTGGGTLNVNQSGGSSLIKALTGSAITADFTYRAGSINAWVETLTGANN